MFPRDIFRIIASYIDNYPTMLNFSKVAKICYFEDIFKLKLSKFLESNKFTKRRYFIAQRVIINAECPGILYYVGGYKYHVKEFGIPGDRYYEGADECFFKGTMNMEELEEKGDIVLFTSWCTPRGKKSGIFEGWNVEINFEEGFKFLLKIEDYYDKKGKVYERKGWDESGKSILLMVHENEMVPID